MIFHFRAEGLSIAMGEINSEIPRQRAAEVGPFQKMPVAPGTLEMKINGINFAS